MAFPGYPGLRAAVQVDQKLGVSWQTSGYRELRASFYHSLCRDCSLPAAGFMNYFQKADMSDLTG